MILTGTPPPPPRTAPKASRAALIARYREGVAKAVSSASRHGVSLRVAKLWKEHMARRCAREAALPALVVPTNNDDTSRAIASCFRKELVVLVQALNHHAGMRAHFGTFTLVEETPGAVWSLANEGCADATLAYISLTHEMVPASDTDAAQYAYSAFEVERLLPASDETNDAFVRELLFISASPRGITALGDDDATTRNIHMLLGKAIGRALCFAHKKQ